MDISTAVQPGPSANEFEGGEEEFSFIYVASIVIFLLPIFLRPFYRTRIIESAFPAVHGRTAKWLSRRACPARRADAIRRCFLFVRPLAHAADQDICPFRANEASHRWSILTLEASNNLVRRKRWRRSCDGVTSAIQHESAGGREIEHPTVGPAPRPQCAPPI